jgi:hypothetical protein
MRPENIDYSSKDKHFFDTENGEILAGHEELVAYGGEGAENLDNIYSLGSLLRNTEVELPYENYDQVDGQNWPLDRYINYGAWILRAIDKPAKSGEKLINARILDHSNKLGIGPSSVQITNKFGNKITNFYREIRAPETHRPKLFDDWTIDDFIKYVKSVDGDTRPERKRIDQLSKNNPQRPSSRVIHERFASIGGYKKIQELAGYTVVRNWDHQDYIDWGVKFIEANSGLKPTAIMLDYMSTKKLGPSASTVIVYGEFKKISLYQAMIMEKYEEFAADQVQANEETLSDIKAETIYGTIPNELFLNNNSPVSESTMLNRYGKYKIISELVPNMSEEAKLSIASDDSKNGSFEAAIRKHNSISTGDIEYAGLTLGVFDYVWPMDSHLKTLKLGSDYEEYYAKRKGYAHKRAGVGAA